MNTEQQKIVIIDYKMNNLFSVKNAIKKLGFSVTISSNKDTIKKADFIILPGVGSFPAAMDEIKRLELDLVIKEHVNRNKPILGICLGFQLLFDYSEEFNSTEGLGIIKGHVKNLGGIGNILQVPHVGWNKIRINLENNCDMIDFDKNFFYFVHSYIGVPEKKEHIFSTTEVGDIKFCSAIKNNNIIAFQFHPEKSGVMGLRMMKKILDGGTKIE